MELGDPATWRKDEQSLRLFRRQNFWRQQIDSAARIDAFQVDTDGPTERHADNRQLAGMRQAEVPSLPVSAGQTRPALRFQLESHHRRLIAGVARENAPEAGMGDDVAVSMHERAQAPSPRSFRCRE